MELERQEEPFAHARPERPPRRLFSRIINRVRIEKKIADAKRRSAYWLLALSASAAALFGTVTAAAGAVIQAKLANIFSLIFSDPTVVGQNWRSFGLFFLESLPVFYVAVFFTALFALLASLKYLVKYWHNATSLSKLARHGYQ